MINILIVENMNLVRGGLVALLSGHPDMEVVAALESADKALPTALELEPDVVILGACMDDGFAVVRSLHEEVRSCATVIMANRRRPGDLRRAVAAGVTGFLLIDTPPADLADAIRRVAQGERVIDSELAFAALHRPESPLTEREVDVLRLAAQGASSAEIAGHLFLSVRTVRNHISRIIGKIGARNRVDAIRIADDAGWL
ncbi:response regulator transcription factor [Actinoallomurus sp. NBC_01490]|uniref:response regulator transcription factor n=1 Tax=Actinoallomurus sp. NBC_01490 TaxID=2903557 RepID=UPI002E37B206|nr:response regulator transcription factor [Actinoallomurus sp. NBC_01490]